jgi:hypothetical protein
MNDGLNIHPDKRKIHSLHLWVDADFAGVWARRTLEIYLTLDWESVPYPASLVFVIVGAIPTFWSSDLQSETALSTMEAEYNCPLHQSAYSPSPSIDEDVCRRKDPFRSKVEHKPRL